MTSHLHIVRTNTTQDGLPSPTEILKAEAGGGLDTPYTPPFDIIATPTLTLNIGIDIIDIWAPFAWRPAFGHTKSVSLFKLHSRTVSPLINIYYSSRRREGTPRWARDSGSSSRQ
jgi:hypothetical protein